MFIILRSRSVRSFLNAKFRRRYSIPVEAWTHDLPTDEHEGFVANLARNRFKNKLR